MRRKDIAWEKVDWSMSNPAIAMQHQCNVKTVAAWRLKLCKPVYRSMSESHKQKLADARKQALADGRYDAEYARKKRRQTGQKHGRGKNISTAHLHYGQDHPSAKSHCLIAPDGQRMQFDNAEHFVRENFQLFDSEDVEERVKPNGKKYCRAATMLQAVSSGRKKSWKEWYQA